MSAPSDEAFMEFVHELQEIALATSCTVLMTTNVGLRDVAPEQTMVEGLIELNDRAHGWRAQSDLQITKFRGCSFLRGRHAYKLTDDGFVVFPRL
jgi:circadian clock protein KaiC